MVLRQGMKPARGGAGPKNSKEEIRAPCLQAAGGTPQVKGVEAGQLNAPDLSLLQNLFWSPKWVSSACRVEVEGVEGEANLKNCLSQLTEMTIDSDKKSRLAGHF